MSEKFKVQIDEDLEPIIPAFFSNLEKDIQVAESAISSLDGDEIAKMGHKCKGACGSYGFKDLERLFHDFEEDGKSGRFDDAKIKIQKLRRYIANVEIEYTEIDDEDDDEDAA